MSKSPLRVFLGGTGSAIGFDWFRALIFWRLFRKLNFSPGWFAYSLFEDHWWLFIFIFHLRSSPILDINLFWAQFKFDLFLVSQNILGFFKIGIEFYIIQGVPRFCFLCLFHNFFIMWRLFLGLIFKSLGRLPYHLLIRNGYFLFFRQQFYTVAELGNIISKLL